MSEFENSFVFLTAAALTLLAVAGMSMMQTGLVRSTAAATQCLMTLGAAAISFIVYQLVGSLFGLPFGISANAPLLEARFFGAAMTAMGAVIIAGGVAERMMLWPFFLFIVAFSGFLSPCINMIARELQNLGFRDIAGSSYIHINGGAAALAGIFLVGPRAGRYTADKRPVPFPGSNIPLAALGAFLMWCGWFGLCSGAAVLQGIGGSGYAVLYINISLAASAGALAAMFYVTWRFGKPDLTIVLNGLAAGLVAVSSTPDDFSQLAAIITGGTGGLACAALIPLLDRYQKDDPAGVVPTHLAGGIAGLLATGLFGTGGGLVQLFGLILIGGVAGASSWAVWFLLQNIFGLRCSERAERHGLDMDETGIEAYPDFLTREAGRPDITYIDEY